jgi:hypothetical protein
MKFRLTIKAERDYNALSPFLQAKEYLHRLNLHNRTFRKASLRLSNTALLALGIRYARTAP